jgi:hypothetical protein
MNNSEIAKLLALAASRDQRTVGDADVLAWHEDIGDLDFDDAREALRRHFRESTDRLMPAHIRRLVRTIREERRRLEAKAAPRQLPGRFETDTDRDARKARGMAKVRAVLDTLAGKWSMPR